MKAVGIIAEYDPFHAGHAYHLGNAREESGADYVVVVMSPDFLQRYLDCLPAPVVDGGVCIQSQQAGDEQQFD